MQKIAFYIMNSKGYYVLNRFIKNFGYESIEYVVSSRDGKISNDFYNEIKKIANKNNILFYNRKDKYFDKEILFKGYKFSIGWRWLIHNNVNLIVFHDSLLPKYRGFSPLVNSLVNNEKQLGVTALFADKEYDKGSIIMQKSLDINYPIKINEAIIKIEPIYYELISKIYFSIIRNIKLSSTKQNENKATYSLWLDEKDYFINWSNWSANKIKRFIDAVGFPYDNAKAYLNNEVITIIEAKILPDVKIEHRNRHIGKIIFFKNNFPVVICKKGLILLLNLCDKNKKQLMLNFRSRFE